MKYARLALAGFIVTSTLFLFGSRVFAESDHITDAQLVQIQNNCSSIQAALSQVHASDAVTRVNRGQLYESISTNLMAPFNSRVSLNRLDSTTLVSVTNTYQEHLQTFRADYQAYEELLSATMKIKCANEPARFYDKLQQTRKARQKVYKSTQDIAGDIKEYQASFEAFAKSYKGAE